MLKQHVYSFEDGQGLGKELLGGKGASLAEMISLGMPVPPGFTLTTPACRLYYRNNERISQGIYRQVGQGLRELEEKTGKRLGDPNDPLLVSVRSGAEVSMPGMMDTLLNVGLNDETVQGLAQKTGNEQFAWSTYLRFVKDYGELIMGILDTELISIDHRTDDENLEKAVEVYKQRIRNASGEDFPQDPQTQLKKAIETVFRSWNSRRANSYRIQEGIDGSLGTAVNVEAMVFGNMGETSGTGILLTRNNQTGRDIIYAEFLRNAQGEDLVSGSITPIGRFKRELERTRPGLYDELVKNAKTLEAHYKDVQDIEFTVQEGVLYILQTRYAMRSAKAAVRIAVDLVNEGFIDMETAVERVSPDQLNNLFNYGIDPKAMSQAKAITQGLPATPMSAIGQTVFTNDAAVYEKSVGNKVILVRQMTTPDDIDGIIAAEGILTNSGGRICHAALVANHLGKPCIVGCQDLDIDLTRSKVRIGRYVVKKGDYLTMDGLTGDVYKGQLPFVKPRLSQHTRTFLKWIDEIKGGK